MNISLLFCKYTYKDRCFLLALSGEEKQQIITSSIIPVFLLSVLTSYSKVSTMSFVFKRVLLALTCYRQGYYAVANMHRSN